jgi:hypothetical protein
LEQVDKYETHAYIHHHPFIRGIYVCLTEMYIFMSRLMKGNCNANFALAEGDEIVVMRKSRNRVKAASYFSYVYHQCVIE